MRARGRYSFNEVATLARSALRLPVRYAYTKPLPALPAAHDLLVCQRSCRPPTIGLGGSAEPDAHALGKGRAAGADSSVPTPAARPSDELVAAPEWPVGIGHTPRSTSRRRHAATDCAGPGRTRAQSACAVPSRSSAQRRPRAALELCPARWLAIQLLEYQQRLLPMRILVLAQLLRPSGVSARQWRRQCPPGRTAL